jgi:NAD(P)-dependent dehydrogenase (short-subunit alcohol dehydrogenase family)
VKRAPRTILLSGASRGLGRALAHEFAKAGHVVLGCARSPEHVRALSQELGAPHVFEAVDVVDDAAVGRWVERALAAHGPPDLVVCCAGVINDLGELWKVPAQQFDAVIDTNIKGTANVLRHVLPAMIARRAGGIVTISSGAGRRPDPRLAPYCASKFAIEGLTHALAKELPRGMCAVALDPGVIDTQLLRQCWPEEADAFQRPEAWAAKAVPLLLKLAPKHNGMSLSV